MKFFENLLPSKNSKKSVTNPFAHLVCIKATEAGIDLKNNFEFLENVAIENLKKINNEKLKIDDNLIHLWAFLDMKKYLEAYYELIVNPYIDNEKPVKDLDHYLNLPARYQNLLDIKFINKIKISNVEFKKLYIATFEIKDETYNYYRPYVELYTLNDTKTKYKNKKDDTKYTDNDASNMTTEKFTKIGQGYDSNDNKMVELAIDNFNYVIYLSPKGFIQLPLENSKIKIPIHDFITDAKINKLITGVLIDDIEIKF